jgi:hypothetical protein
LAKEGNIKIISLQNHLIPCPPFQEKAKDSGYFEDGFGFSEPIPKTDWRILAQASLLLQ